jgi:rare lipoprotein A
MKLLAICCMTGLMACAPACGAKRPTDPSYTAIHRVQYGLASWYGGRNQGRLMACGKPFDESSMVAANRSLPLGTKVRVTNLRNGRSVVVRIMDRGPYIAGRLIDLSKAAANRLRFTHRGVTPVRILVLSAPHNLRRRTELADRRLGLPAAGGSGSSIAIR